MARKWMCKGWKVMALWTAAGSIALMGCQITSRPTGSAMQAGMVQASSPAEAGRYIVLTAGCNDCHTPGYMEKGFEIPEEQWLTGFPVGFRGPWGTSYASNLRMFTAKYSNSDDFVMVLRKRNARPPMPWTSLHAMSDQDLKALYAYIKSLPVKGAPMPEYLNPGVEPKTPYIVFEPVAPKS